MEMTCRNLNSCLLEVKQILAELRRKGELLYAHTGFLAEVICRLQINVVRRNIIITGPALVQHLDKFLRYIYAETVVPAVFKPGGEFLCAITVGELCIQLALLGQARVRKVTATEDCRDRIEVVIRAICQV